MLEDICCDISSAISKDEVGRIWKSAPLYAVQDLCTGAWRLALMDMTYKMCGPRFGRTYMDKETCGHSE